ncbi:DNA primase [Cryptosporangium sp. NPDC048952]|uniref:DNA primase n=1 Tax=Cryptosporangium sp. NPDC048952 TaxID=3363961 RepID=UPI00370F7D08
MAGRHPEDVEPLEDELIDDAEAPEEDSSDEADEVEGERSESVAEYWAGLGIDPVEIALPRGGVGLTLREYRVVEEEVVEDDLDESALATDEDDESLPAADADADDASRRRAAAAADDEDDDDASLRAADADDASRAAADADDEDADDASRRRAAAAADDEDDDEGGENRTARGRRGAKYSDEALAERFNREYEDDSDDEPADDDEDETEPGRARLAAGEEEAVFLATNGTLHLFRDAASLVAFVKSSTDHDLATGENWAELVETLTPDLVVPDDEDRYELDLVVENLRGGRDVWERDLIVGAGELARDLAYALDLTEVDNSLAPGSPLDDLDEALRAKGFFARRKLKRIGSEQAALAWRSVIGRISSSVEWHD